MLYAGAVAAGAFAGSEVVLFGHAIESDTWALLAMIGAGTIGYTIGSVIGWAIGLYGGRPFLERRGRWFHLGQDRLDRADRWFDRWDDLAVFVGRLTPVARSFVSIPAGVFETPFVRYTVLTFAGSTIWCFGFALGGFLLGSTLGGSPPQLSLRRVRGGRRDRGRDRLPDRGEARRASESGIPPRQIHSTSIVPRSRSLIFRRSTRPCRRS